MTNIKFIFCVDIVCSDITLQIIFPSLISCIYMTMFHWSVCVSVCQYHITLLYLYSKSWYLVVLVPSPVLPFKLCLKGNYKNYHAYRCVAQSIITVLAILKCMYFRISLSSSMHVHKHTHTHTCTHIGILVGILNIHQSIWWELSLW